MESKQEKSLEQLCVETRENDGGEAEPLFGYHFLRRDVVFATEVPAGAATGLTQMFHPDIS